MAAIAIAGAGLAGRLLAWALARAGHRVEVFDASPGPAPAFDAQGAAAFSAAGMLSPLAEQEQGERAALGRGRPLGGQRGGRRTAACCWRIARTWAPRSAR